MSSKKNFKTLDDLNNTDTNNTEKHEERNTIYSAPRSRNWVFTLNNYTEEDIQHIKTFDNYLFQEETGAQGTRHLQGLILFKNARTFLQVKKLIPSAHWEPCKNLQASINYCSKEETRTGNIYASDKLAAKIGIRSKVKTLEEIYEEAKNDAIQKHYINHTNQTLYLRIKLGEEEYKNFLYKHTMNYYALGLIEYDEWEKIKKYYEFKDESYDEDTMRFMIWIKDKHALI